MPCYENTGPHKAKTHSFKSMKAFCAVLNHQGFFFRFVLLFCQKSCLKKGLHFFTVTKNLWISNKSFNKKSACVYGSGSRYLFFEDLFTSPLKQQRKRYDTVLKSSIFHLTTSGFQGRLIKQMSNLPSAKGTLHCSRFPLTLQDVCFSDVNCEIWVITF